MHVITGRAFFALDGGALHANVFSVVLSDMGARVMLDTGGDIEIGSPDVHAFLNEIIRLLSADGDECPATGQS